MNKEEKEAYILTIWEEFIKGKYPDTILSWSKNPKSFIKWSLGKVKSEDYKLVQNNKEGLFYPYNLKYINVEVENNIKQQIREEILVKNTKPKRTRRTKAQMSEARKRGEK